jgi:hypothetical protein
MVVLIKPRSHGSVVPVHKSASSTSKYIKNLDVTVFTEFNPDANKLISCATSTFGDKAYLLIHLTPAAKT